MAWGVPIHVWDTFPRSARSHMTSIRYGKALLDWVAQEAIKDGRKSSNK